MALAGVPIEGDRGKGICGKCRVRVLSGGPGKITPAEKGCLSPGELAGGWVLACRQKVTGNLVIETPVPGDDDRSKTRLKLLKRQEPGAALDPPVRKYFLKLNLPSLEDRTPDLERLINSLPGGEIEADLGIVAGLPRLLRGAGFQVTAVLAGNRIVAVEPGNTTGRAYGLALDLGTTTLAGYLVDLVRGEVAAVSVTRNPQSVFGADVISRIRHAYTMRTAFINCRRKCWKPSTKLSAACWPGSGPKEEVYEAVVVGNTTMVHLFLGVELQPGPDTLHSRL